MKGEASNSRGVDKAARRGRGRGAFHRNSRGRGRGRGFEQRHATSEQKGYKSGIQCHHCKKFGHVKANCWNKEKQVNYAEEVDEESNLFMVHHDADETPSDVWFVDSGCSNHMSGMKAIFKELDETQKMKVKLGDNKEIQVEGKGTVAIKTSHGKVKLLHDVQFVPSLAHNLFLGN